jgi:magnesium transporter
MPEIEWTFGYPLALLLMLISSVGCYWFFRWRGWL